ncbi:MAG TPA: hypothetical protein VGK39_09485 [Cyclobacteriaceae bacterium]
MKKRRFLVLFLLSSASAFGQLNNSAFEQRMAVSEADSNKLFLGINFLGFGKNNEWFDTTVDGYTLFGYQLNPYLSYHIAKNVRLDAGVYAQKDFGNDDYSDVKPTLSLKITNNKRNSSFIFGTLEGSVNHGLIEPLYDFERVLNNRLENGLQMLFKEDKISFDAWIDWQNMIYFNDTEPERFTAGFTMNTTLFRKGGFHIDLPIQVLANHQGGQIDSVDNPVITVFNVAAGLTLEFESNRFVTAWGLKSYLPYHDTSSDDLPYQHGKGIFINPYVTTKIGLTVMGSYWWADKFLTVQGGDLYPSINKKYPTRIDEERTIFMLRVLYDVKIADGLILTARAEPFYDTYAEALEYSFGLYLNFSDRFFLLNAKKNR